MTAMNSPSTKSLSNSLVPVRATGNPCLERWSSRFRGDGFSRPPRDIALPSGRAMLSTIEVSRQNAVSEALIKQAAIQFP